MGITLATKRLAGRPVSAQDAPLLKEIFANPLCARWLTPNGQPPDDAAIQAKALRAQAHWAQHEIGLFLWFAPEFVGWCGLAHTQIEGAPHIEIAWSAKPCFWGQGYVSEAAAAVLEWAKAQGVTEVVSFTLVDNQRSLAVMKRLDFELQRPFEHVGLPHLLYRLKL